MLWTVSGQFYFQGWHPSKYRPRIEAETLQEAAAQVEKLNDEDEDLKFDPSTLTPVLNNQEQKVAS